MSKQTDERLMCAVHWCHSKYQHRPKCTIERLLALTGYKDSTVQRFLEQHADKFDLHESGAVSFTRSYHPQAEPTFQLMHAAGVRRADPTIGLTEATEIANQMRVVLGRQHKLRHAA